MRNVYSWGPLAACLTMALGLIALAGCSDNAPPIGKVTGKVTANGKPVPGLTVNFMPENGRPSWGTTDDRGNYKLHWDIDHDGAEVGNHRVSVAFEPGSAMASAGYEVVTAKGKSKGKAAETPEPPASPMSPAEKKTITDKYGGFDTTPLTQTVKAGTQVIDLKLD